MITPSVICDDDLMRAVFYRSLNREELLLWESGYYHRQAEKDSATSLDESSNLPNPPGNKANSLFKSSRRSC